MAVKTISRIQQFELEATAAQHYSLNRVWHTWTPRLSEAVEYENYFHEDVMDNEDYISSGEKANHLDEAHNYLRTMSMCRHDQQTVEMFVKDAVCSQTDNKLTYFYCMQAGHRWLKCKKFWNKLKENVFVPRKATGKASGTYKKKDNHKKKCPDPVPHSSKANEQSILDCSV